MIDLYYREYGNGSPLILLHGNGEGGDYFNHQVDYFKNHYHVYVVDTRGHGKSLRGIKPFTIKQFAIDLNDFLIKHNIDNPIILGFSDGANIAIQFQILFNKARALILNSGNIDPSGVISELKESVHNDFVMELSKIGTPLFDEKRVGFLNLLVNDPNITIDELHSINVPTLVIVGDNDLIRLDHSILISDNIKDSEFVVIKGTHSVFVEDYVTFNQEVDSFLRRRL